MIVFLKKKMWNDQTEGYAQCAKNQRRRKFIILSFIDCVLVADRLMTNYQWRSGSAVLRWSWQHTCNSYKYGAWRRRNNTHLDVVTTWGVLKASYIHVALYYPRDENHWPHSKLEIVWNTGCCLLKMSSYYSYAFRNANKCLIDQLISKMTSCIPNRLSWSIS